MHSDGAETSKRSHWERLPIAVALEPVWSSTEHDGRKAGLTDTLGDKLQFGDDQERMTGYTEVMPRRSKPAETEQTRRDAFVRWVVF